MEIINFTAEMYVILTTLSVLILGVVSLWSINSSLKKRLWLLMFVPFCLITLTLLPITYYKLLGYPTERQLPQEFYVISYKIAEPKQIFLWILSAEYGKIPISYKLPYTRKMHKQLKQLSKGLSKGQGIKGQLGSGTKNVDVEFQKYDFNIVITPYEKEQ